MEKHCVSFDLSKKLKELGMPQTSEFYWKKYNGEFVLNNIYRENDEECYSAYLASELGEMLPESIKSKNSEGNNRLYFFSIWRCNKGEKWRAAYNYYDNYNPQNTRIEYLNNNDGDESGDTMADCMAKMLIYLLENSLLKPEDLV